VSVSGQGGYTLAELLVASTIVLLVVGGALTLTRQAHGAFQSQPEAADEQQRTRVAADAIQRDLMMAGAGTYAGPAGGALTFFMAPVMPYRAFGASADPISNRYFRSDAVSYLYVPHTPSQTRLATPLLAGAVDLDLEVAPNCPLPSSTRICGFGAGDRILIFAETGEWDVFRVDQVSGGLLRVQHAGQPLANAYAAGATVTAIELGTYYVKTDPVSGTSQLVRYDGWLTDSPLVEEVVDLRFRYFGVGEPPALTGAPLGAPPGPWTTYGPAPPTEDVSRGGWPPGENCLFARDDAGTPVPRLPVVNVGGWTLAELPPASLVDGPWCPSPLAPNRFDADLLRVRQVHVSLRVQSALASLRGPAGVLFARSGTARAGDRYVPDIAVEFDVAPRNMNLSR